jgi:hypothetical protein
VDEEGATGELDARSADMCCFSNRNRCGACHHAHSCSNWSQRRQLRWPLQLRARKVVLPTARRLSLS